MARDAHVARIVVVQRGDQSLCGALLSVEGWILSYNASVSADELVSVIILCSRDFDCRRKSDSHTLRQTHVSTSNLI